MKTNELVFHDLGNVKNPSALVSLQFCNKEKKNLSGIEKFKNLVSVIQTELDISGNFLTDPVPELLVLKFLKKLNLTNNQISEVWPVPVDLENLSLGFNRIRRLNSIFPSLQKLHTLDISNNLISSIVELGSIQTLKCLYANNNQISSLNGIEKLSQILELDFSENCLSSRESIVELDLNTSASVVNIQGNPVLEHFASSGFAFENIDEFPKDFIEIEFGLYFRNPKKLRKLKSSRYKGIIKQYKNQEKYSKQLASPDWGCSKVYSCTLEVADDSLMESFDEKPREYILKDLKDPGDEDIQSKKHIPIAKLHLEKISDKTSYEKSSTKPESNLESLFEELISYCQLDENTEKEFSFSNEKYEHAVNVLKNREDERKSLILSNSKLKASNQLLNQRITQMLEENNFLNQKICDLELGKEEYIKNFMKSKEFELEKKSESSYISSMPTEVMEKSREVDETLSRMNFSFESGLSSFSQLPETNIPEYSKCINGNEYLVDKNIGMYIQQLLKKISSLVRKNKILRDNNKKLKKDL